MCGRVLGVFAGGYREAGRSIGVCIAVVELGDGL